MSEETLNGATSIVALSGAEIGVGDAGRMAQVASEREALKTAVPLVIEGVLLLAYTLFLPVLWGITLDFPTLLSAFASKKAVAADTSASISWAIKIGTLVPILVLLAIDFSERICAVVNSRGGRFREVPDALLRLRNGLCCVAPTLLVLALMLPIGIAAAKGICAQLNWGRTSSGIFVVAQISIAVICGDLVYRLSRKRAAHGKWSPALCAFLSALFAALGPILFAAAVYVVALMVLVLIALISSLVRLIINLLIALAAIALVILVAPLLLILGLCVRDW